VTFSLGRVGLPTGSGGDGLTMAEPVEWEQSGSTITLRGIQSGLSETNLLWWRDQMLGLLDGNGEDALPVRSTVVSGFDGYYRLLDLGVNHPEGSLNGGTKQATWAVALERLQQWKQPRFELSTVFGLLTNSYAVGGTLVSAVPPGVVDWTSEVPGGPAYTTRSTGDGASVDVAYDTSPSPDHGQFVGRYLGVIGNHYLGACRVEYDAASDGTFRQIVGYRTIDSQAGMALLRLSNGLVRCTITNSGQDLSISHWDGSQWDTAVPVQVVNVGITSTMTFQRASVLRNSPTQCVVRCFCGNTTGGSIANGTYQIDLSIRRGLRAVFIRVIRANQWRLQFASATASTTLTSGQGIRQTSNNSGGNRVVLNAQDASTLDLVNGRITQPGSQPQLLAAVTCEIGGSGAAGADTAESQSYETFQLVSETQRTVGY
jgi:hypothetical protein